MKISKRDSKKRFYLVIASLFIALVSGSTNADMVGLWRFDEGAGLVAEDSSGFENTGYLYARNGNFPEWITGQTGYGNALLFGKTTSDENTVYVNFSPELELVSKWTLAFWVRIDRNNTPNQYGSPIFCENYVIQIGATGDSNMYFWPTSNSSEWDKWQFGMGTGTEPPLGSWHHVAVTYDGTNFTLYKDGNIVPGYPTSTKPGTSTDLPDRLPNRTDIYWNYLYFGSYYNAGNSGAYRWLAGALDDIAIFDETLDETQIETIMAGDFSGPWTTLEESPFSDYIWNPTFLSNLAALPGEPGGVVSPFLPPNWDGVVDNAPTDDYGIINATGWAGAEPTVVTYAASVSAGDVLYQLADKVLQDYTDGMKFRLFTRVAGNAAAIGSTVGVRFYIAESSNPSSKVQIGDLHTTITTAQQWVELSDSSWTASSADVGDQFYAEAYVTGGTAGSAYGYFDIVHIQLLPSNCEEVALLNHILDLDFDADCFVNLEEFSQMSDNWLRSDDPEPAPANPGELLTNWDFYQDVSLVPEAGDFQPQLAPTGWALTDPDGSTNRGIQNVSNIGVVHGPLAADPVTGNLFEPAGGSVAVYLDPNALLSQTVTSETIALGETYYFSAMVAGSSSAYDVSVPGGNSIFIDLIAVDTSTQAETIFYSFNNTDKNSFVSPNHTNWRRLTHSFVADSSIAGKQFRVRATHHKNSEYGVDIDGWMWVGNMSFVKGSANKPTDWPAANLLTNGDFEDVTDMNFTEQEQLVLKGTHNGFVDIDNANERPTGWAYESWSPAPVGWNGMQSFMWAPSPQPSQGRIAFGISPGTTQYHVLGQKTAATIVNGQTYYLASVSAVSWSQYVNDPNSWPDPDPELTVEVYWMDANTSNITTGTDGVNWGLITSVTAVPEASLSTALGRWITETTSFTATSPMAGKYFYVRAYTTEPIAFFDDIYLGLEPWPTIGAYTCPQYLRENPALSVDIDGDCDVDLEDFEILAADWLLCNEPGHPSCVENWLDW